MREVAGITMSDVEDDLRLDVHRFERRGAETDVVGQRDDIGA
jgi:hypothetical protein